MTGQIAIDVPVAPGEIPAALLQATIAALLAALCVALWRRTRDEHYAWWGGAFGLFALRISVIVVFLNTTERAWLFWHQVLTGWTAFALLWAAAVFARRRPGRVWAAALLVFPTLWSYVAVNRLDSFALAAVPAVLFLSLATLWTGAVLLRHRRPETRGASTLLGWTFLLWGVHHLDYPVLRARGAWSPWGYYLDILFLLSVGAGVLLLVNAELAGRLHARTQELERLSRRMVRHHEEERRRLSLALHDETAQVLVAVKLELGIVREEISPASAARVDRAMTLVDKGVRSVRDVTNQLRPALLEDLGLLPALRSLAKEFGERHGGEVTFAAPDALPVVNEEGEVALFRALQEALANVGRHAPGASTSVAITSSPSHVEMRIADRGPGLDGPDALARAESNGHLGLAGMRERISALGGSVDVSGAPGSGVLIDVRVPLAEPR